MALKLADLEREGFRIIDGKLVRVQGESSESGGGGEDLSLRDLKSQLRAQKIKARDTRSKLLETRRSLKETREALGAQSGLAKAFDPVAQAFMVGTGAILGSILLCIGILFSIVIIAIGLTRPVIGALSLACILGARKLWRRRGSGEA